MKRPIRVHLSPALFEPEELTEGCAVVIDALRATTTIVTALAAGADRIIPCVDVDEARRIAASLPSGSALLGGERGGVKIAGFDLGNSPAEYTSAVVGGKTVAFTTTNGTRALRKASQARRVGVAAFANLNAVVRWLAAQSGPIHVICAGTDGHVTLEDVLCAGAITRGLLNTAGDFDVGDDPTALALNLLETRGGHYDSFLATLRGSRGGRNLIECGFDADIVIAARWDVTELVPELSRDPWQIQPAHDAEPGVRLIEPPAGSCV